MMAESGHLPDELYRSCGSNGSHVAHLDENCWRLRGADGRWLPTEFLRRADYRLCRSCGDGRQIEGGGEA